MSAALVNFRSAARGNEGKQVDRDQRRDVLLAYTCTWTHSRLAPDASDGSDELLSKCIDHFEESAFF